VTARARRGLPCGENAAKLRPDSHHPDRVVKELLTEVSLGLGDLEKRVGASIGEAWLWKVGIVGRHHQLLDATNLPIDEPT
jgi:hypothetical protein